VHSLSPTELKKTHPTMAQNYAHLRWLY